MDERKRVAVVGGTGVAGRLTVDALRRAGHDAVPLSRATGVDVATGSGLREALDGADAVVDTTSIGTLRAGRAVPFFEAAARNLSAAAADAGVGHLVALSIVGIERVPTGYYQGKLRQEEVLAGAALPVSVVRATQFHEFAGQYLDRSRGPVVVLPRWQVQPVAAREAADLLAAVAVGAPVGRVELAGPQVERMADLLRRTATARGERRRVVEVPLPGALGRAMARGGNLPQGDHRRGEQTFADWLAGA